MVRNLVLLSGSSHPAFVERIASVIGVPPSPRVLTKFSSGETRCEIRDSVRGKDVYIVQSFGSDAADGNTVNDYLIELCIMISACKTGSARRVTAVLPLFPYSRQPDLPFSKVGAPLVGLASSSSPSSSSPRREGRGQAGGEAGSERGAAEDSLDSAPVTPGPHIPRTAGLGSGGGGVWGDGAGAGAGAKGTGAQHAGSYTTHDYENPSLMMALQARSGHKQFMAQAGPLVADLLTCAGADRVLTCDLHESAYQGFFDIPVDNLFARPLLQRYIRQNIPNYRDAVIVSPDAGGAKRATAIADNLGLAFALIHKERRPPKISHTPKATMMLVGDVAGRACILIDDLADTAYTVTRAARLLKRAGAARVTALLTHGVLSGGAAGRVAASAALDRVVVTNTVPQDAHRAACPKLEVLDVSGMFAEAIRRVHFGESVSGLFQCD